MENAKYTQQGERLSFFELFAKKHYKVVVPIIQREYAQGRKNTSVREVRRSFLEALYSYLNEGKMFHDLDFVYGNLEHADGGGRIRFIPLDGQQRLTTLFLLHWYLCQTSDDEDLRQKYKDSLLVNGASQFTYETRPSSNNFCDKLMSCDIDMGNLLIDENGQPSLSATIKNSQWYFLSWDNDPTIQSMLVMLDAIHDKFKGRADFFPLLLDVENPVITFLFMDLDKYRLSDDLYIKMNSRGKPLTIFENFKAKLEQYLKGNVVSEHFNLCYDKEQKEVGVQEYFAYNIDTKWTDFFWNLRGIKDSDGNAIPFDTLIEHFVRILITDHYASTADITQKDKDDNLDSLLNEEDGLFTFSHYVELSAMSTDAVLYLIHALDRLSGLGTNVSDAIATEYRHYFNPSASLQHALQYRFENRAERLNLYAFIGFLIRYGTSEGIDEWMRVVANLTHPENTITNTAETFAAGLKSIDNMLPHADNILHWLTGDPNIDRFSSWQVEEEKVKAALILRSNTWKDAIEKVEKHGYFNGQIGFILDFAGILPYYKKKGNCDWGNSEDEDFLNRFRHYCSIASKIFANSYDERINDTNCCFERAVLTRYNYIGLEPDARLNLSCTAKIANNVKRDFSWKRRLRAFDDSTADVRKAVKEVFDDPKMDEKNIVASLENICKDGVEDSKWRNLLVCQPQLMMYPQQGFISFFKNLPCDNIVLYGQSRMNHWHVELYTYALWLRAFTADVESWNNSSLEGYSPFTEAHYWGKKVNDELSCITLQGYSSNGIKYQLQVFANVDNRWELTHFDLIFARQTKVRGGKSDYDNSVVDALNLCDFKWQETEDFGGEQKERDLGLYRKVHDGNAVIECIKQLCKQLPLSHS